MIHSTSNLDGYNRRDALISAVAKQTTPPQPDAPRERLSSSNTDALRAALASTPEIRPEAVERGHKLRIDPNYPPRHIIEDLARLMVASRDVAE